MPARSHRQPREAGFTIIELLITIVVLGLIGSAVAGAIILFFRTADGTSRRLSLSHDSQLLAIYLVPDLDSLGQGQPVVTSSGSAACGQSFSDIQISFTGPDPHDTYQANYTASGSEIIRTFTHRFSGGPPITTVIPVVHNLKPGNACFSSVPSLGPWTMRVTAEAQNDPSTDYSFSVTGGRATAPPTLCSTTCAQPALVSKDMDGNGKMDHIVAAFDGPLNTADSAGKSEWVLSGQPDGVTVAGVSVSGNSVTLALSEGTAIDTFAGTLSVEFRPDPGGQGVRNAANQPAAAFGATSVSDGMAPVLTSIVSQDADSNGRMDHVKITFSEPLQPLTKYSAGTTPWKPSGQPSGVTVKGPDSIVGNTVTLQLNEGTGYDTLANGFQLAMDIKPGGIQDGNGNISSFVPTAVADGMTPVATSLRSQDVNQDGKVDRIVITFSEPLVGYAPVNPPWTLTGQPAGVTLNHTTIDTDTATLFLDQGTAVDTTATGFQVSLAADPNGVRDAAGHLSSFGPTSVSDGMGPVIVGLTSTNSNLPGKLEPGDTLTLTFSEDLLPSSLPRAPSVQLVAQSGDDLLRIPGVVSIDLGDHDVYVDPPGATFASSLSSSGAVVTIVIGANTSGPLAVRQSARPTPMIVTPLPDAARNLPKDLAGNVADGGFDSAPAVMVLF